MTRRFIEFTLFFGSRLKPVPDDGGPFEFSDVFFRVVFFSRLGPLFPAEGEDPLILRKSHRFNTLKI